MGRPVRDPLTGVPGRGVLVVAVLVIGGPFRVPAGAGSARAGDEWLSLPKQ